MKILLVQTRSFTQNESGVPRITYNLGRYFTEKGLEVGYYSFKDKDHIKVKFGQLLHVNEEGGTKNPSNLQHFEKSLYEFHPDVVINQMPYEDNLSSVLYTVSKKIGYKIIGCIHNSLFTFKSNVKDIMRRQFPKPLNNLMATELMSKIPLANHKVKHRKQLIAMLKRNHLTLLYTPPNFEELIYFLKEEDYKDANIGFMPNPVVGICEEVPAKEKTILHVGSINVHQKRSDLLLDFWENTYQGLPDWKFQVVGKGEYLEVIKADLQRRKLPRIELLGFQKPDEYYKKASIFMMPSAYEGLPNTIIEANSFGCPVLAFNSYAALEWIVQKEVNARLATPYDTKEMATLCIDLANDSDRLKAMQQAALVNAKRFSIDKVGQDWIQLFHSLV